MHEILAFRAHSALPPQLVENQRFERACLRTKRLRACAVNSTEPPKDDLSPAERAVQERIRRAQQYKKSKTVLEGPERRSPEPALRPKVPTGADLDVNARFKQYGAQLAEGQEVELKAALDSIAEGSAGSNPALTGDGERFLKQQRVAKMGASGSNRVSPTLHAKLKSFVDTAQPDTFSTDTFSANRETSPGGAAGPLAGETPEDLERRSAAASGSASEAAAYLRDAAETPASDAAGMRAEEFTALKEERVRARGVEFITRDGTYDPLVPPAGDPTYKPKVATWGMFPRPTDISKSYGGGKTYRPGEALETAEQAQERKERLSAAILDYRRKQGLFVDPEEEAKWNAVYATGVQLLTEGRFKAAMAQFEDVLGAVPARSKLGGEAQLQHAICLDSAGQNKEAYKVYMMLERHPNGIVQKKAKRMLFGFRAADNLKASTMSYAVGAKGGTEWDKYFMKLSGQWSTGFVEPGGDEDATLSYAAAAAVVLTPLLLAFLLVLPKL